MVTSFHSTAATSHAGMRALCVEAVFEGHLQNSFN